jgi:hypothetical protein
MIHLSPLVTVRAPSLGAVLATGKAGQLPPPNTKQFAPDCPSFELSEAHSPYVQLPSSD